MINLNEVKASNLNEDSYILTGNSNIELTVLENTHARLILKNVSGSVTLHLLKNSKIWLEKVSYQNANFDLKLLLLENAEANLVTIQTNEATENISAILKERNASFNHDCLCVASKLNETINTMVIHDAKETKSNVRNYGVALEGGNINFNTTGKIDRGNSKSSCQQLSRGIIAGNKASVKSEPILLIDEYDVKANHGAAIGKMSDDELFYLMSRGLSKEDAFKLILSGIVNPIVESLSIDDLKAEAYKEIGKNI